MASHNDEVRRQFALQATTFGNHGFATRGLDWIVDTIDPQGHELVLDVACGAAHLARALAPRVTNVCGVDLTAEMLQQADLLARQANQRNITLQLGDAAALPWIDRQFDLAVCRLTLHQVADPAAVVREMVRVTRPGGRIVVADMIVDDDDRVNAAEANRLERLRDPSHGTTLTAAEISRLISDAGAHPVQSDLQDQPLDLEDWMQRAQTPEQDRRHIRQRLQSELDGGDPSGLHPQRDNGRLTIRHRWLIVVADVPA